MARLLFTVTPNSCVFTVHPAFRFVEAFDPDSQYPTLVDYSTAVLFSCACVFDGVAGYLAITGTTEVWW